MSRASSLHPFTRRVALAAGGFAVVVSTVLLVWARSRLPSPEELDRRVVIELGLPGEPELADGAHVPAHRPLEVRFRHDLPRPLGLVLAATAEGQPTQWLVPAAPSERPLRMVARDKVQARVLTALPPGRWQVVSVVGIEDGKPAIEWLNRTVGRRVRGVEVR